MWVLYPQCLAPFAWHTVRAQETFDEQTYLPLPLQAFLFLCLLNSLSGLTSLGSSHSTFYTAWYFLMFMGLFQSPHLEYFQGISISSTQLLFSFVWLRAGT